MSREPPPAASTPELPILAHRDAILAAIREHPVVIVAGDTGSGKTTQIPKFCLELGRGDQRLVGCTQPRRLAAVSVAERVAQELGTQPGTVVGWQHRFGRCLSQQTRVKFMTDGILLAETRADPDLRRYDTIMVDEAHERSLNIDFLLGYLRLRLSRRPDLKVIISSATLDVARFSAFFGNAPVVEVPGRLHPVEVRYRPPRDDDDDLAGMVADGVDELAAERDGDILVFLPGERDIRAAAETLRGRALPDTEVLPLMASLPPAEQRRAFRVLPGRRRVILATNVAETSLTIPGIRMVVDSGLARISRFNHRTQVQRLHVEPISRASAEQRKGRCGRLGPGVCIRLYAEDDFERRDAYTDPEIRRTSLGGVILTMADLRLGKIDEFPFLDPPSPPMVRDGYRELGELAAIDAEGRLTPLGRQLARMPIEPRFARMLVAAHEGKTLRDALTVVAALACDDPRLRPLDKQADADKAQAKFQAERSDFAGLLLLWRWYHETGRAPSRGAARRLCSDHFLSFRRMDEWVDVREQLERTVRAMGLDPASASDGDAALHRALLTGMLSQIGMRDPEKGDYRGARGLRFAVHPGSGLFKKQPAWVMAAELVDTARLYARRVAAIDPDWIEPLARHLCKYSNHSPYWDAETGTARALERVTLHGLLLSDGRRRDYSRIDPVFSRQMLIRHGLVAGELPRPVPEPLRANLVLFEALRDAHRKTRGKVPLDEEVFVQAYERVLPADVANVADLRAWLKKAGPSETAALRFSADLLSAPDAPGHLYPDRVVLGGRKLTLAYRHEPGADDDGITCTVPLDALSLLRRWPSDWLVPGLLPDKVAWMLSALPKPLSKPLPPLARALPRVLPHLREPSAPLATALRAALRAEFGLELPGGTWPETNVPPHLRVRLRVVDERRREVFVSRRPEEIEEFAAEYRRLAGADGESSREDAACAERENLARWDCGPLPESVEVGEAGWRLVNHPALVDEGGRVALRWFADAGRARALHATGVRRLYALALGKDFATLAGGGVVPRDTALAYAAIGGNAAELRADAALAAIDAVLLPPTEPIPRDSETFRLRLETRRGPLGQTARTQCQLAQSALALAAERERELASGPLPAPIADDIREQLAWLVFPGFARHVAPERLAHYGRYLEALRLRILRARENPSRDLARTKVIRPFWERYRDAVAGDSPHDASALADYRWAVEEFRVSQHAQELRTPEPVSPQRLERLWPT